MRDETAEILFQSWLREALCGGGCFFCVCVFFFSCLSCEDFGRMFDNLFPACAFFLKWGLGRANYLHFLVQGQSTVAQRAETTWPNVP